MEDSNEEETVSMGPAALMSGLETKNETDLSIQEDSFLTPEREFAHHAMGMLSLSSIMPIDNTHPDHILTICSPGPNYRPDILMSTINPQPSSSNEDLSISIGPLSAINARNPSSTEILDFPPDTLDSSLLKKIEQLELQPKKPIAIIPPRCEDVYTQTEEFHCEKCEEFHLDYNQKLQDVAKDFQTQFAAQFQMIADHNAETEEAENKIKDLTEQRDAADKQLKASRLFLEQQAAEREQEREEASKKQKQLEDELSEREKELEKEKTHISQLTSDLQHLQDCLEEKEAVIQEHLSVQQRVDQQFQLLKMNQCDLNEENNSLQQVLEVKEKLLKAQADQIAALRNELENQFQMYHQSESERECERSVSLHEPPAQISINSSFACPSADMPTLFEELQQLIVRLLHKVDRSTRALEAAQWTKHKATLMISPRSAITPSTSTEDISIKDRHRQSSLDNLRELSPSPPASKVTNDPELALNFLQQLDGKLIALGRVEEGVCKRIADLETELRRIVQSEKQSSTKVNDLEQQQKQYQQLLKDVEAEKQELLSEHTELLKRISSLENRLEEQRRSAVIGATQNVHTEKLRQLSEEKQQLALVVGQKDECIAQMQDQVSELHQRIEKLMKSVQEKEQQVKRHDDFSSTERLRDVPHFDSSMNWTRLNVQNSPVAVSPIFHHQPPHMKECPDVEHLELEELRAKLLKSEQRCEVLQDELTCHTNKLSQLESMEQRNASLEHETLEKVLKDNQQLELRCQRLEKDVESLTRQLSDQRVWQQRCVGLEQDLSGHRRLLDNLEKDMVDLKEAHRREVEKLRENSASLEATSKLKNQELDAERMKSSALEAEVNGQRSAIEASRFLHERVASLQNEAAQHQQTARSLEAAQKQCASLRSLLNDREEKVTDLQKKLQWTDNCKVQVEKALLQLQREVEAVQQAQQLQKQLDSPVIRESSFLEGPTAPPDLLAPSFVEFLGSATSSRCSSRKSTSSSSGKSSPLLMRTTESTLHDFSLPNSMVGKKALRNVQQESQELLAFGKRILELQRNKITAEKENRPIDYLSNDDELESTLKPESEDSIGAGSSKAFEAELRNKIEWLESQLAMERLLLQDQRAANAIQQKQMIELLAQQRLNQANVQQQQQKIPRTSSGSPLPADMITKVAQYRLLKSESLRKNLIHQKKFLTAVVNEFDPPVKQGKNYNVNRNRFKIAALTVISVLRMRFIVRQWRHRRKSIQLTAE